MSSQLPARRLQRRAADCDQIAGRDVGETLSSLTPFLTGRSRAVRSGFRMLLQGRMLTNDQRPSIGNAPGWTCFQPAVASPARNASTRCRLTPKSLRPTREAERTCTTWWTGPNQSSRSSTNFINRVVHWAYR